MAAKAKAGSRQASVEVGPERSGSALSRALGPERVLEIQRARIVTAMVEECGQRGAANVSVAHVVQRAGVSRRTFYEVFGDREDCFLGAFEEAIDRALQCVRKAYDPNAKWVERIRAGLTASLEFLDFEPGAGQLAVVGSLGAGPRALERRQRGIAQIVAIVDEGRKETKAGAELLPLTAEGIVGGVLSVLHSRLLDEGSKPLVKLIPALMSMIALPYLGPAAARRELARPIPPSSAPQAKVTSDPLRDLGMRLTYRTVCVLMAVAATPGGSNRQVADRSGISDQGQISKLLVRLHRLGLIENTGSGSIRGAPNSWVLTDRGWNVQAALVQSTG